MGGAKGVQIGEGRGDGVTQLLFRIIRWIPGVNVKSGVQETGRPGSANQSRADYADGFQGD